MDIGASGGRHGAILAVAVAKVTVFDNSDDQLGQDRALFKREDLKAELIEG